MLPEMLAADFLKQKLLERKARNSSYSIRAFARDLDVSSGRLIDLLNQKVPVGPRLAAKIAKRMELSLGEAEEFRQMALNDKRLRRTDAVFQKKILEEELALIVDPIHFDLLSLMETRNFKSDIAWIARRLGKEMQKVETAFANLIKLKMVTLNEQGKYTRQVHSATTTNKIPSEFIREQHRQGLHEALASLDKHTIEQRDFSSITMAVNTAKVKEAMDMIKIFRRRLCRHLQIGPKTEVYTLKTQFFPKTEMD